MALTKAGEAWLRRAIRRHFWSYFDPEKAPRIVWVALADESGSYVVNTRQPWDGQRDYTWTADRFFVASGLLLGLDDGDVMLVPLGVGGRELPSGHQLAWDGVIDVGED